MIRRFSETSPVSDLLMEPSAETLFAGPFTPIACADLMGIEALRLGPQPSARQELIDWDEVHTATQAALEPLSKRVAEVHPEALVKAGRTTSRSFPLFSYQTYFHLDGNDDDPIIVGVAFDRAGDRILASGDISGEESGHIYFDEECSELVTGSTREIVGAGSRVASRLASQWNLVLQAIRTRLPQDQPG